MQIRKGDSMSYSSKVNNLNTIQLDTSSELTEQELFEFRNNLNADTLGFFDDIEGYSDDESIYAKEPISHLAENSNFIINDNLTTINFSNGYNTSRIKFIVIHYTANNGDTAWGNTNYFKSTYREASAHYFVDETSVWRCVNDQDISWHCGGGLQGTNGHSFFNICTNTNSIGIEMCSRKYSNGTYYFKEQTIMNCILLVKYLMNKYNVSLNNVIRHFDVTGKICPAPFVNNDSLWNDFKNNLNKEYEIKPGVYKVVNCDELNIRNGNSISYKKIGSLQVNTLVDITEFNNGWGKINHNRL